MSISSTANRVVYTGNGVTTAFSFPYEYFASTDLVVLETVIATGVATTKALTTDYIVSGVADASGIYPNGGTVTALVAPASTVKWTIYRDPSPTQTTVFVDNASLPSASLNNGLDKLTIICQRLKEIFLRSARLADGDISGASVVLPTPVASQLLGWDSLGTSIISYASSTIASGVTITTFAASMLASASATTWRSLLGLGGAALLADPIPTTSGGTGTTTFPSLTNTRLAKTALYTVANADKGKTIALGGSAFYNLAFSAASGYDANFSVLVLNEDTGRGKNIVISGGSNFILWPGQSCIVFNQNNVWKATPSSQRWAKSGAVFYVDPVLGSDTNDGLATGAGAFLTIQGAYNVIRNSVDCLGGTPTINLADGTHSVGSGVNLNYALMGSAQLIIAGNNATPANVIVSCNGGGNCFVARDGGVTATLSGMTLSTIGNGSVLLSVSQNAVIDICASGPVNFNAAPLGIHMSASTWASINVLGNYTVNGSAVTHVAVSNNAYINYGGFTVTGASGLTFTVYATGTNCGVLSAGGVGMSFSGFGAVTSKKYAFTTNAVLDSASSGANYPGATTGTVATGAQAS